MVYNVYTNYKNGDDWGMVFYVCFTHIIRIIVKNEA